MRRLAPPRCWVAAAVAWGAEEEAAEGEAAAAAGRAAPATRGAALAAQQQGDGQFGREGAGARPHNSSPALCAHAGHQHSVFVHGGTHDTPG
eukprot:222850-Chlamydomonas_euryale.AAC.5